MNVAFGMAEQSRVPGGSNKKKLALGKAAAKAKIAATRKKTKAKKGS